MLRASLIVITLIVTLASAGCGFRLRGNFVIPEHLKNISLEGTYSNEMQCAIRDLLDQNNISITDSAPTKLIIAQPVFSDQQLTIDPTGVTQRVKFTMQTSFKIKNEDGILHQGTVRKFSVYSTSINTVLQDDQEKNTLRSELIRESANELIRQLVMSQQ